MKFRKIAPTGSLQIIEMDIKYVWIEGTNKYAFVFTILDTFTRYALHWSVGYSMKSEQIKWSWEYVIAEYLQPHGVNPKDLVVEVRSDNGKQFTSDMIRQFFVDNGLNQVFTKPYTPEENGHIESFHCIINKALANDMFIDLKHLEQRLERFYICYNNDRSHSGTKGIPPTKFWTLFDLGYIDVVPLKINQIRLKLKVAYQDILTLPDINKYQYRVIQLP
ncbi:MAG: transposase [Saprospiraceae bacterium]|nr:transposase [Saprospiraceae bacterium]